LQPDKTEFQQVVDISGISVRSKEPTRLLRLAIHGKPVEPFSFDKRIVAVDPEKDQIVGGKAVLKMTLIDGVRIDAVDVSFDHSGTQHDFDRGKLILTLKSIPSVLSPGDRNYPLQRHTCLITVRFTKDGVSGAFISEVYLDSPGKVRLVPSQLTFRKSSNLDSWQAHCLLVDSVDRSGESSSLYDADLMVEKEVLAVPISAKKIGPTKSLLEFSIPAAVTERIAGKECILQLREKSHSTSTVLVECKVNFFE
ncbi:MAG: hypothetical protein ABL921_27665, partial [Pirellula sp.]